MDKNKMRYLKTYKLFESNWYDMRDHINVLSDMSLPLWDKEFNVQVSDEIINQKKAPPNPLNTFREHQCIVVNIIKKGDMSNRVMNRFTFPVIKEELLEMVDYMDREGWEVLNMEANNLSSGYFYCYLEGDKLLTLHTDREITEKFDQLIVKFVEKEVKTNESTEEDVHRERMIKKYGREEIEECDEVIRNINDMLLELEDLGLMVFAGYTPMTTLSVDSTPKLRVEINAPEELYDSNIDIIHIVADQIVEYIKSFGFIPGCGEWISNDRKVYAILIQK